MSSLEDMIYHAHQLGVRTKLFKYVKKYRNKFPTASIDFIYDKAYEKLLKKQKKRGNT